MKKINVFLRSCYVGTVLSVLLIESMPLTLSAASNEAKGKETAVEIQSNGAKRILHTPRLDIISSGTVTDLKSETKQHYIDLKFPSERIQAYQIAPSDVSGELKSAHLSAYLAGKEPFYKVVLSSRDGSTHFEVNPSRIESISPTQVRLWYDAEKLIFISTPIGASTEMIKPGERFDVRFLSFQAKPGSAEAKISPEDRSDYIIQARAGGSFSPRPDGTFTLMLRGVDRDGAWAIPFKEKGEADIIDAVIHSIKRSNNPLNADLPISIGGVERFARFTLKNPVYDETARTLTAQVVPLVDIDGTSIFDKVSDGYMFSAPKGMHVDFGYISPGREG